ncbi:hypothetical protein TNCV_698531 [Trichonephila clavipes]|nr:hypothetical protein TNCV_698531 [Trichonephila clavipes]
MFTHISIGAPDLRRDLNLLSEHLGNSIEILYLSFLKFKVIRNMYQIAKSVGPSRRPRIFQSDSIDQWPRFSRPMGKRAFNLSWDCEVQGRNAICVRRERNSPHWSGYSSPIGRTSRSEEKGELAERKNKISRERN